MNNMLQPITYKDFLKVVKIPVKNINDAFDNYANGILDINKFSLNLNEKHIFNKENEIKYINFMKQIYNLNKNKPIVIDFYLKDLDNEGCLKIIENLDYEEKIIFINHIRNLKTDKVYFLVNSEELIPFITKLSTRELHFCTMYFNEIPITIWGNYNLAFPVFFNNNEDIEFYKRIACENNLFIRSLNLLPL